MYSLHPSLHIFVKMARIMNVVHRKFEGPLNGISFTDFIILLHISKAPKEELRMVDIADRVGLTPSGITRVLLPMEKIGLIEKHRNPNDARSSIIKMSTRGKEILAQTTVYLEEYCEDITTGFSPVELVELLEYSKRLGGTL